MDGGSLRDQKRIDRYLEFLGTKKLRGFSPRLTTGKLSAYGLLKIVHHGAIIWSD